MVTADIDSAPGIPIAGGALAPAAPVVSVCGADAQAVVATGDADAAIDIDSSYFVIFE